MQIDAIAKAGRNWSIEVTPPQAGKIPRFADVLARGTTVNVTFLPGSDFADTIAVAERLHDEGMNAVPHIAARSVASIAALKDMADSLAGIGVREALVIAGGLAKPVGEFTSSMEILETGILPDAGITRIGIAGHPEGSPDIDTDALADAILWKNRFARDNPDMSLYMATQFCFEAAPVIAWEAAIREVGNKLPIRIGVPGPASIKTLLRFAQLSGIGPSMRMVTKQARNVKKLMSRQAPDGLIAGLAGAMNDRKCLLESLHYYPFGGFARTANWARAVAAGQITLHQGGGGFEVTEIEPNTKPE